MAVLDTNVILRHLLSDDAGQSPRASRIITDLASGTLQVVLPESVIFEVVFVLERREHHPRSVVRDLARGLLELPGVTVANQRFLMAALDLHVERNISLVDAAVCLLARETDGQVISFDRDFDRIAGLTRVEP